jgi:hypothetical protein
MHAVFRLYSNFQTWEEVKPMSLRIPVNAPCSSIGVSGPQSGSRLLIISTDVKEYSRRWETNQNENFLALTNCSFQYVAIKQSVKGDSLDRQSIFKTPLNPRQEFGTRNPVGSITCRQRVQEM